MKIALFFGSFNPIHLGHIGLGKYIVENKIVDEVWYIVSPKNPLKDHKELVDEHNRLEMLKLAIQNEPHFKAFDIEFKMPIPSYTIDTLRLITQNYPAHHFALMIGSDNALVFNQWKNYQEILSDYEVIVYPRKSFSFEKVREKYPQMKLINTPYFDISSTQIRKAFLQKKDITKWLHPSVYQFIIENNLYKKSL